MKIRTLSQAYVYGFAVGLLTALFVLTEERATRRRTLSAPTGRVSVGEAYLAVVQGRAPIPSSYRCGIPGCSQCDPTPAEAATDREASE